MSSGPVIWIVRAQRREEIRLGPAFLSEENACFHVVQQIKAGGDPWAYSLLTTTLDDFQTGVSSIKVWR